jgi:hypothetical protein
MPPSTIGGINLLPEARKREMYGGLIPPEILTRFKLPARASPAFQELTKLRFAPGASDVELSLFHAPDFRDPVLYGHLTDTLNGQIHILLYILNDPDSPRFNVDRMPDGRVTKFGTLVRNLEAEAAALQSGLAPGQVRRGLRMLRSAIQGFEAFATGLGHDIYFIEPLYYHNALIFERHGFAYQQGRNLMERIQQGFAPGGDLARKLDGSAFRTPGAADSVRLRSWAIHDGILDEPFTHVTMYKRIGKPANVNTAHGIEW